MERRCVLSGAMPVETGTAATPLNLDRAVATGLAPGGTALSPGLVSVLRSSLAVLREAVALYGPSAVATAFNGGKDATVVLHLVRAVLNANLGCVKHRVLCMYLVEENSFEEVDRFVVDTVARFDLESVEQEGGFKCGIQAFVELRGVRAFVMGTRRSDPHAAGMRALEPSSPGWPEFMRVNPILEWEYAHVWEFLRCFELPFCTLYDRGYTSIGNTKNTNPNPALAVAESRPLVVGENDGAKCRFLPAWKLSCQDLERAGRDSPGKHGAA